MSQTPMATSSNLIDMMSRGHQSHMHLISRAKMATSSALLDMMCRGQMSHTRLSTLVPSQVTEAPSLPQSKTELLPDAAQVIADLKAHHEEDVGHLDDAVRFVNVSSYFYNKCGPKTDEACRSHATSAPS